MRKTPSVFGVLVLAMTLSACGGSSEEGAAAEAAAGEEFRTEALAVCAAAYEMKESQGPFPYPNFNPTQPDASLLPKMAPFLAKTATTFETWLVEMRSLGEPPSGRDAWADLVGAVQDHARIATEQAAAAERSDTTTFTKDYLEGVQTQQALLRAATDAGVPECAEVDR